MKKSIKLLVSLVLLQLVLPAFKVTGVALVGTSWLVATCLFWGPWLMILVFWLLGLLLRQATRQPPLNS
ncbi:hypothetical protein [Hymenobacter cheonanensis]|uniref:hypothetical protein n=1 Tax=Hymenobacter sp. CA2-7 TaxID=3063993 RepID=UPI002712CD24|nr:hypothetical protein [Hymenobacter sp. CA2-7]MDO7885329.1 hypothetical protein [Hymenobacter sp. CA2-7]